MADASGPWGFRHDPAGGGASRSGRFEELSEIRGLGISVYPALSMMSVPGPKLLHCVTVKGKGFALAEKDQTKWHAPGLFDKITGEIKKSVPDKPQPPKYQDVFGHTMVELAEANAKIVGITPAMPSGCSLNIMMKAMPNRAFDVGIAEQHAVTFAAGLACEGLKPVVAIYSTFLQRGYDQLIHDVALQNLPVVFALDRAGLVGADGATHAGAYDIAYIRCIPNMSLACPADERECRQLLSTAYAQNHPVAVRYPRGAGVGTEPGRDLDTLPFGKGEVRRQGEKLAILAFGTLLTPALEAAEKLNATVVNMRWVKPLDVELLAQIAQSHERIVTVEEGCILGGAGSAVGEALQTLQINLPVLQLGLPDDFIEQGDPAKLLALQGLDALGIEAAIRKRWHD